MSYMGEVSHGFWGTFRNLAQSPLGLPNPWLSTPSEGGRRTRKRSRGSGLYRRGWLATPGPMIHQYSRKRLPIWTMGNFCHVGKILFLIVCGRPCHPVFTGPFDHPPPPLFTGFCPVDRLVLPRPSNYLTKMGYCSQPTMMVGEPNF